MNTIYLSEKQRDELFKLAENDFDIIDIGQGTWYFYPKDLKKDFKNYPEIDGYGPYACAWITSKYTFELSHEQYDGEGQKGLSKEQKEALRKSHNSLEELVKKVTDKC